ncbi:MAG: hypothetical protein KGJ92_07815 [Actinomycetales bacterium]|nr:hypothetical protein [Actinomycetales bacterium]
MKNRDLYCAWHGGRRRVDAPASLSARCERTGGPAGDPFGAREDAAREVV